MFAIRTRLTFWYVALLCVTLVAVGAFVVLRLRADLTADVDHAVRAAGAQIAEGYALEGDQEFLDRSQQVLGALPPGQSASQVLDASGRVLLRRGAKVANVPTLTPALVRRTLQGPRLHLSRNLGRPATSYRLYAQALTRQGQPRVLVVVKSLAEVNHSVHRLIVLLLIGGAAALLLIALGGFLLARHALRPVATITAQANRIGIKRLGERIPSPRVLDEIGRLVTTLNAMLDRLDRGVQEQHRLVADASHELRTPLAVMRSELDVALLEEDLTAAAREVLVSARDEVDRMTRIVENLLTLAQADECKLELHRQPVDLLEIAAAVTRTLDSLAASRGVSIRVSGEPAAVLGDSERLHQVVTNLLVNAVKYTRPNSDVRVRSWREAGQARLEISDAGEGIDEAALEHVFDRFYRVDRSRSREGGGSGLGLAICREIIEAHGGRVWATSEPGSGASFFVSIPAAPATSQAILIRA
jgi:heavy metal sensor kinase